MSAKTTFNLIAGALLIVGLAVAWRGFREKHSAETDLAVLVGKLPAAQEDIRQQTARIEMREKEVITLRTKLNSSPTSPSPAASMPQAPLVDPSTRLEADPQLRALYLKQLRANASEQYRLMYQRLKLRPDQIARFEELAAAHEEDSITLRAAARAQGFAMAGMTINPQQAPLTAFATNRPDVNRSLADLIKQNDEDFYATVGRELGPEVAASAAQNDRIADIRTFVGDIDGRKVYGVPGLTDAQSAQLADILLEANSAYQAGRPARLDAMDWNAASARAAVVLSESQFKAFKTRADFYNLGVKVREFRAQQKAATVK